MATQLTGPIMPIRNVRIFNPIKPTWGSDFCDAENADAITGSSHKNRIYCITRDVTEFVKLDKQKVGQYILNLIYRLVSES